MAAAPQAQRDALVALYNSTNGDALLTLNTPGTHTYTLECTDGINTVSAIKLVTVLDDTNSVKINSFAISPTEIDGGWSTVISWDVSNAESCTAQDGTEGWPGVFISTPVGQKELVIEMPGCHTFTLECADGLHVVSASHNVSVINTDVIFADKFEAPAVCVE